MNNLLRTQSLIEQNEDITACIVENMQLGRFDDCIQQFPLLLNQLIGLSLEFDNYPAMNLNDDEDTNNGINHFKDTASNHFPDRLMRKDILDDLRNIDDFYIPTPPPIPVCLACHQHKRSSHSCRTVNSHIQPNYKLSNKELSEFLHATEILAQNHGLYNMEKVKNKSTKKKLYQKWTTSDKYTVMLAIATLKTSKASKIRRHFKGLRSTTQVRSFITKNFSAEQLSNLQRGIIPPPPPKYQPPINLTSTTDVSGNKRGGNKSRQYHDNNNSISGCSTNVVISSSRNFENDDCGEEDDDVDSDDENECNDDENSNSTTTNVKHKAYTGTSLLGPVSCGAPGSFSELLRLAAVPPSSSSSTAMGGKLNSNTSTSSHNIVANMSSLPTMSYAYPPQQLQNVSTSSSTQSQMQAPSSVSHHGSSTSVSLNTQTELLYNHNSHTVPVIGVGSINVISSGIEEDILESDDDDTSSDDDNEDESGDGDDDSGSIHSRSYMI